MEGLGGASDGRDIYRPERAFCRHAGRATSDLARVAWGAGMSDRRSKLPINIDEIQKVLIVDNGLPSRLRWARGYGGFGGKPAGHLNQLGYWTVRVKKRLFYAHRIVKALTTGKDPGQSMVRR
jgi:hypothetical protein